MLMLLVVVRAKNYTMFHRLILAAAVCLLASPAAAFVIGNRWMATASDRATGTFGQPITLSWSIVPDGTLIPGYGGSDLVSWLDASLGGGPGSLDQRPWFDLIAGAFDRWQRVSGVSFVYEPNDDGFAHGNAVGELDVRGDVRLGGAFVDGPGGTLAFTGFVPNADIAIDTSDSLALFDETGNYLKFRNTLMHEIGHSIGLRHLTSPDAALLMEPAVDLSIDGPQLDDIRGVHRLFGDRYDRAGNNTSGGATWLGHLASGSPLVVGASAGLAQVVDPSADDFASISGPSDPDWFAFDVDAATVVDIRLEPRGGTLTQTPEGGTTTTINASASSNLGFNVFGPEVLAYLGSGASQPAGQPELLSGLSLPAAGRYFVQVVGFTDAVQLYRLEIERQIDGILLPGDYNGDGWVDAADYAVWRDALGTTALAPFAGADGNGDGSVDQADYAVWRQHFGQSPAAVESFATAVPEPSSWWLLLLILLVAKPRSMRTKP
jgi:hypothetical protein